MLRVAWNHSYRIDQRDRDRDRQRHEQEDEEEEDGEATGEDEGGGVRFVAIPAASNGGSLEGSSFEDPPQDL